MTPNFFSDQIRQALANPDLQAALDANAEKRIQAVHSARASLPEPWEVLRRRAHNVRAEVIENLDRYLEEFVSRLENNGVIVHHAATAAQAAQIVLDIAKEQGALLAAKSKSMVSEEIELNHALEAAGMQVVETDLGEYIIQLRNERPSHIITPAVHLRRQDVGLTFHEKLGIPLTDDIPTLTTAARARLRQVFLQADIGISGVNFGVAESGTLCIVTNEGNGRMCTTLPRVHIALMGIERIVPRLADLALMLYLLPRSATGQKLSVYTSLIHSPRQAGELDGPQERHVVLVDNGRSAMRRSPLAEGLLCIRCGACLNACPVFREIGGHGYTQTSRAGSSTYPGPIGSIVSPGLFGQDNFGHLARASSLCGACREACPVDIDLPKLLLRVRAGLVPTSRSPALSQAKPNAPAALAAGLRLFSWLARSAWSFALAQKAAGLAARMAAVFMRSSKAGWLRLPDASGWGISKDFPVPAAVPFRQRFAARQNLAANQPSGIPAARSGLAQQDTALHPPMQPTSNSLQARFAAELQVLGGETSFCHPATLTKKLLELLRDRHITRMQTWDADTLPVGLVEALKAEGILITTHPDPGAQAGLSGALAGIAETGSLVLTGGPGRPLSTSLLAPLHIAVLEASSIKENLPQVLQLAEITQASAAVLVTGPSRTADIEMTLTIGVHGPGSLHVFCISSFSQ